METIHTASSLPTSFSSRALATMDPAAITAAAAAAAVTLGCFEANTTNSTEQRLYTKRN